MRLIEQDPELWLSQASGLRRCVHFIRDPSTRSRMLKIAEGYEKVAHAVRGNKQPIKHQSGVGRNLSAGRDDNR
jgi:hypothetical protein